MLIESIISLVAKLGGFSVVVGLICKVFVDWYLMRKTAQYEKDIEKLKHELSTEIEKSKSLNDQISHKNKLLFDEEVLIYKKIAPLVNNVKDMLMSYIVNYGSIEESDAVSRREELGNALDLLREEINDSTFFIDDEISNSFKNFYKKCLNQYVILNEDWEISKEEVKEIKEHYDTLKCNVRAYLTQKAELN